MFEQQPHNIQTEKAVLWCIIMSNDLMYHVDLNGNEFYSSFHRLVWLAMQDLKNARKVIDMITLSKKIGDEYLNEIMDIATCIVMTVWFEWYVDDLKDLYYRREILKHAQVLEGSSKSERVDIQSVVQSSYTFFSDLMSKWTEEQTTQQVIDDMIANAGSPANMIGLRGLDELDTVLWWVRWGEITIVAARPWQGKSVLSNNLASNLMTQWVKSMTISLEMPKNQLMQRIFSIRYWVRKKDFDKWSPEIVMDKLVKWWYVEDYMKLPDYIYLSTGKSIDADIYNIIYRSHYRDWVWVFIIDYIGLMSTSTKQQSRAYEIWYISGKLKQISMELWVHIVILSQINRSGANRPKLEDLKDSWSLEQDADYVIGLQNEKDEKWLTNQLDILVLKNRNWIVRDISYKQIWLKVTNDLIKTS